MNKSQIVSPSSHHVLLDPGGLGLDARHDARLSSSITLPQTQVSIMRGRGQGSPVPGQNLSNLRWSGIRNKSKYFYDMNCKIFWQGYDGIRRLLNSSRGAQALESLAIFFRQLGVHLIQLALKFKSWSPLNESLNQEISWYIVSVLNFCSWALFFPQKLLVQPTLIGAEGLSSCHLDILGLPRPPCAHWILASDWSRVIAWPRHWPLIGHRPPGGVAPAQQG